MDSPGALLRAALTERAPVIAPGVFDGLSAHLARRSGCAAVYASGGAIARGMGLPDLGLAGMAEIAGRLREIVVQQTGGGKCGGCAGQKGAARDRAGRRVGLVFHKWS